MSLRSNGFATVNAMFLDHCIFSEPDLIRAATTLKQTLYARSYFAHIPKSNVGDPG